MEKFVAVFIVGLGDLGALRRARGKGGGDGRSSDSPSFFCDSHTKGF